MTLNPDFVKQIDEYLSVSGLSRSGYIENCMLYDILCVQKRINDPDTLSAFGNDRKAIILNYFRSKIGEGDHNGTQEKPEFQ